MPLPLPGFDPARTVTRHRYAVQTIGSDGRPNRGAATSVAIRAAVRDLDMRDLASLPEGWRLRAKKGVTCEAELRAGDDTTGAWPDVVEVDGTRYSVLHVGSGPPVGGLPRVYDALCEREPARGPLGWPT